MKEGLSLVRSQEDGQQSQVSRQWSGSGMFPHSLLVGPLSCLHSGLLEFWVVWIRFSSLTLSQVSFTEETLIAIAMVTFWNFLPYTHTQGRPSVYWSHLFAFLLQKNHWIDSFFTFAIVNIEHSFRVKKVRKISDCIVYATKTLLFLCSPCYSSFF